MLEESQKQSNRAGNLITDPTLLLFVSNAMLRTNRFLRANEIWGDLPSDNQTWARGKTIYCKADMADKVKKAVKGRQEHFGAHGAFDKVPNPEALEDLSQLSVEELDGYFRSLANAATTEKDILAALVKINATLTTSNATLTATVANLKKQLSNLGETPNPPQENNRQIRTCPNCKKDVYHAADDFYELKNNAHMRHPGCRSRLL